VLHTLFILSYETCVSKYNIFLSTDTGSPADSADSEKEQEKRSITNLSLISRISFAQSLDSITSLGLKL